MLRAVFNRKTGCILGRFLLQVCEKTEKMPTNPTDCKANTRENINQVKLEREETKSVFVQFVNFCFFLNIEGHQ